jgi:hypothetical protein
MKGGDFLEIEFSGDTLEGVKLNAQLFSRVINPVAKGEKQIASLGEKEIEGSWPIITQPIAILDTIF